MDLIISLINLKRVIPGLKNNDEEIDEATSIEQEVNRYIVTPEENKEKEDDDEE